MGLWRSVGHVLGSLESTWLTGGLAQRIAQSQYREQRNRTYRTYRTYKTGALGAVYAMRSENFGAHGCQRAIDLSVKSVLSVQVRFTLHPPCALRSVHRAYKRHSTWLTGGLAQHIPQCIYCGQCRNGPLRTGTDAYGRWAQGILRAVCRLNTQDLSVNSVFVRTGPFYLCALHKVLCTPGGYLPSILMNFGRAVSKSTPYQL